MANKYKVGETYGIYTLIAKTDRRDKTNHRYSMFRCNICGRVLCIAENQIVKYAKAKICHHSPSVGRPIKNKRLRSIFNGMYRRCYSPKDKDYHVYGNKGIRICNAWINDPSLFEKWSYENGYTDELTIDRIDPDKSYKPSNCRWVTFSDNAKFRSITNVYTVHGITDSGKGWAKRLGIPINRINIMTRKYGRETVTRYIKNTLEGYYTILPKDPKLFYNNIK